MIERHGESGIKQPNAAVCLGFLLSALAGSLGVAALWHWKESAPFAADLPEAMRSGGVAFSMNMPGIGVELAAYVVGFFAFIGLASTWLWSPPTIRTWYSIGGLLALVPVIFLLAKRLG